MPANTYTLIEKIVVGAAGASSITFTSIPQTYTDLKVVISVRDATNNNGVVKITFNGSATGYTARQLYGTGSVAASNTDYTGSGTYYGTEGSSAPSNATASTFSNCEFYIPNYTSSNNKSISADSLYENNASLAYQSLSAGLWSNSAAITSITVTQFSGNNFAQYSTAYLYGIAKEGVSPSPSSAPYATGGDSIVFDGTYWIHTFTSSGTFTPNKSLTCDYLVVAGGGAGAKGKDNTGSGGGGAGGYRTSIGGSAVSFSNNVAYTVTVGAGGAAGTTANQQGPAGSNSSISGTGITTITSTGGAGGVSQGSARASGGSGGGGESFTASGVGTAGNSGSYSPVEGYAGGNAYTTAGGRYPGGGGGGSSAVGGNATSNTGGAGGAGTANSISGSSVTYAGGGGGGTGYNTNLGGAGGAGGSGGGGAGSNSATAGTSGTANLGGGGGGGSGEGTYQSNGGSGGSGIVIVRYAA